MTWRVTIELQIEATDLIEIAGFLKGIRGPEDISDKITGITCNALTPDEEIPVAAIPNN